jgi:Coenzyme PQQ synthesis protein D (PqqD)
MHMHFYVRSDSVVSRVIAGETLIVPVRKGVGDLTSIYSLNAVGSSVWKAIGSRRSKAEIVETVEREFDAECSRIEHDIDSFLAEMCSAGLVLVSEAAA